MTKAVSTLEDQYASAPFPHSLYTQKITTLLQRSVKHLLSLVFLQQTTSRSGTVRTRVFTHILSSHYYHICFLSCTCYVWHRFFRKM